MLDQAIKKINACFSLTDLRDLWAENTERWKALPADQAGEIIRLKDARKTEIVISQDVPFAGKTFPSSFIMISDVIGKVPVEAWQDRVIVEGVTYLNKEINDLKILGLSGTDMRAIHETKKQFEGAIIPERKTFGKVQTLDMNTKNNH